MRSLCRAGRAPACATSRRLGPVLVAAGLARACAAAASASCPGSFPVEGYGDVELVPTGWIGPESKFRPVNVKGGSLEAHMDARAYFANACTPGKYDNTQYVALNLLGKAMRYTTDVSGAGCGCNAAFYLTSMAQNKAPSECGDHYCDANNVCGQDCAEIDIQEANQFAWHSTLHAATDSSGLGAGYGGGDGWDGPRDWGKEDYAPRSRCIDTDLPFQVEVSFPVDEKGVLRSMDVTLSQGGCDLRVGVGAYEGNGELTEALQAGMTPIVSYWSANDMLWMDGVGEDKQGPCSRDDVSKCTELVRFYNFSVSELPAGGPKPSAPAADDERPEQATQEQPEEATEDEEPERPEQAAQEQSEEATQDVRQMRPEEATPERSSPLPRDMCAKTQKEDCTWAQCCRDAGMQCYRKNEYWSACKRECSPGGLDPEDEGDARTPWWCEELGERTPGKAASRPNSSTPTTTAPSRQAAKSTLDEVQAPEKASASTTRALVTTTSKGMPDGAHGPEKLEALSSGEANLLVRLLDEVSMPQLEQGEAVTVLMGDREARATVDLSALPPPAPHRAATAPAKASPTSTRAPSLPHAGTPKKKGTAGGEAKAKPPVPAASPAPTPAPTSAPPAPSPPPARQARGSVEPGEEELGEEDGPVGETEAQRRQRMAALIVDGIDLAAAPRSARRAPPASAAGSGVLAAGLAYVAACAAACAAVAAVRRRRWALPGSQLYGRVADGEGVIPTTAGSTDDFGACGSDSALLEVRVAVVGAGPGGAMAALLLAARARRPVHVDLYERHTPEECRQHRRFFVDVPGKKSLRRLGLSSAEIGRIHSHFEPSVEEVAYCSLTEALLTSAKDRARMKGSSTSLRLLRPQTFEPSAARGYDWVIDASGRHRTLHPPGGGEEVALTPAKLALDVGWTVRLAPHERKSANRRLSPLLQHFRSHHMVDRGHDGTGRDHNQLVIPDPAGNSTQQLVWMVLLPKAAAGLVKDDAAQLTALTASNTEADAFFQKHSGLELPDLSDMEADIKTTTAAVHSLDQEAQPLVTARVMQEVYFSPAAWMVAGNESQWRAQVLLVGESAWAKDAPFHEQDAIPDVFEQASAAASSVTAGWDHDQGSAARRYADFMAGEVRARREELARIRAELAAQDAPDPLLQRVYGAGAPAAAGPGGRGRGGARHAGPRGAPLLRAAALRAVALAACLCEVDAAMAPTRKENASPWYCKWCRHDVTNQPWFNASTLVYCKKCGLHKSNCFKENKAASQPSASAKQQSLAAKVKELEAQLAKLREHPPGQGPTATGTGASPPWAAAPGDADTVKRSRIKMLDQLLRVTTDPADADIVAKWREERARLDAELFQDRPIEHQARSLASRLSSARARQATIQATRDEQQRKIDELTRGLADTDSKLQEAAAEVLRLEQQTRAAMSRVQPPEGTQPPTLADLLPTFAVSVEQLGKVASGLGLGADMVKELQAMANTVSKLQNMPQAKPPEPAPAPDDEDGDESCAEPPDIEMSEQEYRETLGAAGVQVEESDTPDIVREKFKRLQQSYLDTVAKKGDYGITEGYSVYAYAAGPWQHALLTDLIFGDWRQRAPTVLGRHALLTALALGESRRQRAKVQPTHAVSQPQLKGLITTVNATSYGPLFDFLATYRGTILLAQELRITDSRLGEFQARALDAGWHGLWAPSPSTGDSATSNFGGVAVLVPTYIMVTAPPDDGHIIYPGRAVCAQINWGVAGGIIVASVYLVTSIGISGENIEVLWALAQRVAAWNSRGLDWILGGDWNSDIDALNVRNWVETMAAVHYVPDQHTCITDEGKSTIDYFVVCANLASRIKGKPEVQYDSMGVPPPHFPVELQLMGEDRPTWCRVPVEPRPFAVVPPVGCARYPYPWHRLRTEFQRVSCTDDLSSLWDSVLRGVDYELAGRYDCVGAKAMQYIGREGPPQFKWQHLSWQPPRRRTYKEPTVLAWATAKRWAQHLVAEKKRLVRYIERLKLCAAVCDITPLQYTKVAVAFNAVAAFYRRAARSEHVLCVLDAAFAGFFRRGLIGLVEADFEDYVSPVLREVSNLARAAKAFTSDAGDLGMVLKPPKFGCIPWNQKVWGQLKRHLGTLKIPYRAHMRNLGHELTGPRVLRHMEKRRLVQFRERKHRFRMLKSAWRMAVQLLELATALFASYDIVLQS
ncbi:unnamed protein product [Prorocentrum cordatum]|uniref:Uncharacterized protein n=1 Tax=Prorocentrum cordatum TaxID=2364126 RepID=A0ABN9T765_9DINO|nr:unnamed protein product [Polarella glacialis]